MHFKGGLYKLIGYAYHSETQEEMVIYQALYGMHKIWVRPKTLFFDKVIRDGIEINRFTEIAEKEIPYANGPNDYLYLLSGSKWPTKNAGTAQTHK